jgi:hypothetical protein
MLNEYLEFDTVPSNEPCVQINDENYRNLANLEADVIIDQIKRTFPQAMTLGFVFKKKYNNHDFGNYLNINVFYNPDIPEHDFIYDIDRNFPESWDEVSLAKLMESEEYAAIIRNRK